MTSMWKLTKPTKIYIMTTLCVLVAGIQGPVIVAQAGDKVVVHFKNLASQPYSISPVGITYGKKSEGSELNESNCCHPFNFFCPPSQTEH